MNNQEHLAAAVSKLEAKFDPDMVYDFLSGFHDVIVHHHTSAIEQNPHLPTEQPCHNLYHLGATTAEKLLSQLTQN